MRHILALACLALPVLGAPAQADVTRAIDTYILPGYGAFARETADLAQVAPGCDPAAIRPAWQDAFDAWMGVSHLRLGPIEEQGRALIVAFWPDKRGATRGALAGLVRDADPIIDTAEGVAELSVAARGLFALEYLLYDPEFTPPTGYSCDVIAALSADLARIAETVERAWRAEFAQTLRSAGDAGNTTYLDAREARQALYTALLSGLEFTADQRLGRPLGSFDRPRPKRAEAWRAGRSLRNIRLSLKALRDLARALSDQPIPQTEAAFEHAIARADLLDDPGLSGVADPQERLRIEVLQQAVQAVRDAVRAEMGPALGVSAGFNAADGD